MANKAATAIKKKQGRPSGSLGKKKKLLQAGKGREALKPLLAPLDLPPVAAAPPMIDESGSGLLAGVQNLLSGLSSPSPKIPPAESLNPSESSCEISSTSDVPPMSEENARLLASVPERIGGTDTGAAGGALPAALDAAGDDPIAALMASVAFEPQDVQDALVEFCDWIAERARSDHWKLTDRQARLVGRPLAQVLNASWKRLQVYIPDILGRWCESTPGAMALLAAVGLVFGPKLFKQISISRERRGAVVPITVGTAAAAVPAPAPLPSRPPGGGIVWEDEAAA